MYRVIVVDDEIWSVIGLKRILQEDSRFELVYETTDSLDALEKICAIGPDVVFTDVRMPEMSGLDLMRGVKARGVKTEFVVISGFAEFTYVQQALQEGAVDYHLKPFDRNTTKPMLDRLCEKLDSQRSVSDLEFYSYLRDEKDHVAQLLQGRFAHPLYNKLQLVVLYCSDPERQSVRIDAGENAQCLSMKVGPRKHILVINSEEDRTEAVFESLRWMDREIEKAAISRVSDHVESFEQLIKEAETTFMDSFVYPNDRIFRYRKARRDVIDQLEERITELHNTKKFRQIGTLVTGLRKVYVYNDMGADDAVYFWNCIARFTNRRKQSGDPPVDYLDIYELTERFADLNEMCTYLVHLYLDQQPEETRTVNDKFFEMLRYIDENYAEPLYLKELCNMFFINMSYCCELFQKHENMTFSQYLTHVRIRKACDLLKYQHTTVSEACEQVGYKDYFYFNKVFKKTMGCTPAEYRKNQLTEN